MKPSPKNRPSLCACQALPMRTEQRPLTGFSLVEIARADEEYRRPGKVFRAVRQSLIRDLFEIRCAREYAVSGSVPLSARPRQSNSRKHVVSHANRGGIGPIRGAGIFESAGVAKEKSRGYSKPRLPAKARNFRRQNGKATDSVSSMARRSFEEPTP